MELIRVVPDPPQATHLIDPALLDPHCDTCLRKFDSKQLKTAYQCHKEGCRKAVHQQRACSGFRPPKGKKEQAAWLLKVWLCKEHKPTGQTNVNARPLALPPPPPSLNLRDSLGLRPWQLKPNAPSAAILSDQTPTPSDATNVADYSTSFSAVSRN